jgi:hypothetical protein
MICEGCLEHTLVARLTKYLASSCSAKVGFVSCKSSDGGSKSDIKVVDSNIKSK